MYEVVSSMMMKNVYIGIFALFVTTALVGIWFWDKATPRNDVTADPPRSMTFTQAEVTMHDTGSDCWSTVNDTVYNLT